jgi:hypothetical protein
VRRRPGKAAQIPGLVDGRSSGQTVVTNALAMPHAGLGFAVYFPTLLTTTSRYQQPAMRLYTIHDRAAKPHRAYRIVLSSNPVEGQYWGVQGTTWRSPPILQDTHDTVLRRGRRLSVYRDGSRIRLAAWRTRHAVYWVSNSLSLSLTNSQMLEIAATLGRRHRSHP